MNYGGERIEIVSRLFGVLDKGDVAKIRTDMRREGYFQNEDPMWNGRRSRLAISREVERSQGELDRRLRELYAHRVKTGEGGGHYAAQVLGHEIGHTIANLPRDCPLGPVGDSLRTLFDVVNREFQKTASPLRKAGDRTVDEETRALARVKARDVLAESIKRGSLGGFQEGLKDLPPELQRLSIRYVVNGWKQYHADPRSKQYRQMRAIKDPALKAKAMEWIDGGAKWQD